MSIKVHGANVEYIKFSAGEPHVKVTNILSKQVTIDWRFENFEEFAYVALICDVLHRNGVAVTLYLPYVPFARQDRATTVEQPFSLDVFVKMLQTLKIHKLVVWDVHSSVFQELFNTFLIELLVIEQVEGVLFFVSEDELPYDCIIAPDSGAISKASAISSVLGVPLVCATKTRNPLTGKLYSPVIDFGDLKPKRALIPDDILDYGGTFIQLADVIKKQFPDIVLDLYVTHGIFAAGREELDKRFDQIYVYHDMRKKEVV